MNLLYNFSEIKEAYKIYIMENLLNTLQSQAFYIKLKQRHLGISLEPL